MSALAYNSPSVERFFNLDRRSVSTDANVIKNLLETVSKNFVNSISGERLILEPLRALQYLIGSCAINNWDGEGSEPIPFEAFEEAQQLLSVLPSQYATPEISPEPMGAIAFEWYVNPNRVFVVSLSGKGSIQYAALFGIGNEDHGKRNFSSLLPPIVLEKLEMLYQR
jgi:hypothetical protein